VHQWRQSCVAAGEAVRLFVVREKEEVEGPFRVEEIVLDALVDP